MKLSIAVIHNNAIDERAEWENGVLWHTDLSSGSPTVSSPFECSLAEFLKNDCIFKVL